MSEFRKHITARHPDNVLIEFDFCQLEVAGLAEVTREDNLIHELNEGVDIHRRNAARWKGTAESDISDEIRTKAKVMTFQMQYGASSDSMAKALELPKFEVDNFKRFFYKSYPAIAFFHDYLRDFCKKKSFSIKEAGESYYLPVGTPTGRKYFLKSKESTYSKSGFSLSVTEAFNYPIQGFATGDLVPIVINLLTRRYPAVVQYLVTTVHDSVLLDIPIKDVYTFLAALEETFCTLPLEFKRMFDHDLRVHYDYDVSFGSNWKELTTHSRIDIIDILIGKGVLNDKHDKHGNYC